MTTEPDVRVSQKRRSLKSIATRIITTITFIYIIIIIISSGTTIFQTLKAVPAMMQVENHGEITTQPAPYPTKMCHDFSIKKCSRASLFEVPTIRVVTSGWWLAGEGRLFSRVALRVSHIRGRATDTELAGIGYSCIRVKTNEEFYVLLKLWFYIIIVPLVMMHFFALVFLSCFFFVQKMITGKNIDECDSIFLWIVLVLALHLLLALLPCYSYPRQLILLVSRSLSVTINDHN